MEFTVGGEQFSLDRKEVERKLKGVKPEPIQKIYVIVNGTKYPVKQALAVSASMIRAGFTSQYAFRIFRKLGFELGEE